MISQACTLRVIPTLDKTAVVLIGNQWRNKLPVAELPGFIALYRRLRDRDGGKYARFYAADTAALEAAASALGIHAPDLREKPAGSRK